MTAQLPPDADYKALIDTLRSDKIVDAKFGRMRRPTEEELEAATAIETLLRAATPKQRQRRTRKPWKPEPPCPYDLNNAPGWRLR